MNKSINNLQDIFLNNARKERIPVTIFLVNGVQLKGIVKGFDSFTVVLELPNTVEGLVHVTSFRDDYYIYDEENLQLIGERTKKVYKLGEKVKVLCSRVEMDTREVYFEIVEDKYTIEEKEAETEKRENLLDEVKKELEAEGKVEIIEPREETAEEEL